MREFLRASYVTCIGSAYAPGRRYSEAPSPLSEARCNEASIIFNSCVVKILDYDQEAHTSIRETSSRRDNLACRRHVTDELPAGLLFFESYAAAARVSPVHSNWFICRILPIL